MESIHLRTRLCHGCKTVVKPFDPFDNMVNKERQLGLRYDGNVRVREGCRHLTGLRNLHHSNDVSLQAVSAQICASFMSRERERLLSAARIIMLRGQNNLLSAIFRRDKTGHGRRSRHHEVHGDVQARVHNEIPPGY